MEYNLKNWGEFYLEDIFTRIEKGKCTDASSLLDGTGINYIGAKRNNNGVMKTVSKAENKDMISEGNCIIMIGQGAGSSGYAIYMDKEFIGASSLNLGYADWINSYTVHFVCTLLCLEYDKYSFGRSWTGERLRKTIIKLPIDDQGNPNWKYMEEYIKSLNYKLPKTNNTKNEIDFKKYNFNIFKFSDIIKTGRIYKADVHIKANLDEYDFRKEDSIPFISRTELDNSVDFFVQKTDELSIEKGNAIVIGDTTSTISYQEKDFVCGDHIIIIRAPWLNKYTGLYIVTLLRKERFRYSYGRAFKMDSIKNTKLKLPIDDKGNPDWEYMEKFILQLPYGDII